MGGRLDHAAQVAADQDAERYLRVGRLFPHQPIVVLCMLVKIFAFDCIPGRCGGAGERQISFVVSLGISKANAFGAARFSL
jgi:hypothetical protein